jgi:hypothetical protein
MISQIQAKSVPTGRTAPAPAPSGDPDPQGQPTGDVDFSWSAQDSTVFAPGTTTISNVGKGPSVDQAKLDSKLKPNNGKYVYDQSDKRFHAAISFATVAKTIKMFEDALGDKVKWAFGSKQLNVHPDAGEDFNAYYTRDDGSVNFFHGVDPVTKQTIFSADSGEVVAHETGHALLDAMRPGYFSTWSPDPAGFHESWGDMMAMFASMQDDRTLDQVMKETGGDLSKVNSISKLGEELGSAINDVVGSNVTGGPWTRNAINDLKWADPSTLPQDGGPDGLGSEAHSYSRLWTGAMYDVLHAITDRNIAAGQAPRDAIKAAGAEGLKLYAGLMKTAPQGDFTYADMAQALIQADKQSNDGKDTDIITKVMKDRLILPQSFKSDAVQFKAETPESKTVRNITVRLNGPQYGKFSGATVESALSGDSPLSKDAEASQRVKTSVQNLIAQGRILYTEPNQSVKTKDLFDKQGRPYVGVVRWTDGHMSIERVKIAS